MNRIFAAVVLSVLAVLAVVAYAGTGVVILQDDRQFSSATVVVAPGEPIEFRNADDVMHYVYSLSADKPFDLGSLVSGESRSVVFDAPGEVEVQCAVHPNMVMTIRIEE